MCVCVCVLLTMHLSTILVTDQLNAQILVYIKFIIFLYTFRALLCSKQVEEHNNFIKNQESVHEVV